MKKIRQNPLMRNNMADGSNINNKESDNAFEGSDDTSSDVDINDLDKLKSKEMALKVGNPKTPGCNCNSDSYIKSLIKQIHYLKEENKI